MRKRKESKIKEREGKERERKEKRKRNKGLSDYNSEYEKDNRGDE